MLWFRAFPAFGICSCKTINHRKTHSRLGKGHNQSLVNPKESELSLCSFFWGISVACASDEKMLSGMSPEYLFTEKTFIQLLMGLGWHVDSRGT